MPKKQAPDPIEMPQHERFKEAARHLEADETGEALERAFGKIVPPTRPKTDEEPGQ